MASDSLGKRQAALVRQWEGAVRRRAIRDGEDTGKEQTARITARSPGPPVHAPPSAFTSPCRFTVRRCSATVTVLPCSSRQAQNAGDHLAPGGVPVPKEKVLFSSKKEKVLAAECSGRVFIHDAVYSVGACNISLILCSLLLFLPPV